MIYSKAVTEVYAFVRTKPVQEVLLKAKRAKYDLHTLTQLSNNQKQQDDDKIYTQSNLSIKLCGYDFTELQYLRMSGRYKLRMKISK